MANAVHLLTLPREIRNQIYDSLFQETQSRNLAIHRKGNLFLNVTIRTENSPLTNVLVHSQINAEYLESAPFRNLFATVFTSTGIIGIHPEEVPLQQRQLATTTLRRTMHLTLYHFDFLPNADSFPVSEIVHQLLPISASLRSLRLATRRKVGMTIYKPVFFHFTPLPRMAPATPATTLLGLPLVQLGSCFGVRYDFTRPTINGMHHMVDQISFQVYTTGKMNGLLWDKDVAEEWAPWPCPNHGMPAMTALEWRRFRMLKDTAFQWDAKRVDEVKNENWT